jgi:hypothetical protein
MNSILDPAGGRPSAVYWRRRAAIFAAFAVVLLLMVKACGGSGPNLSPTAEQQPVPLVSTYTPTPTATATPSGNPYTDASSDPALGGDPNAPYDASGTPAAPCADPTLAATLVDEAGQPLCGDPTTAPTATPTATRKAAPTAKPTAKAVAKTPALPAATPSPAPVAAAPVKCAKAVLSVALKSDRTVYTGSQKPKLYLGVKNSGPDACLVDLGSRALSFTIISGKDRIWSSDDCQGKGTSDVRLLQPGQTLWARSVWGKVRSAPGCPNGMAAAKPGYYRVEGSAGGVSADRRAVFQVK